MIEREAARKRRLNIETDNWRCAAGIQIQSPTNPKPVPILQRLGITPVSPDKSSYSVETPKEAMRKRKPPLPLKEKLLRTN